ncbi:DUF3883 domain-containing protein [Rhizobacter sp. Root404]|uniref:DUF3883 domain-containing protein n=1 Tax=Rhizobacter sp. Root404 TaxID=1736528 RepID=UPI0006F7D882|nr:DUF3883 domain-containing protein [Rhizobacter sp. Root404]KQW36576.1 hypothetical protein ASC76_18140 [Rhizobacter sp. Root404]
MSKSLSQLRSPASVQAALDEFVKLGRSAFLERYQFGKSRDYLVRDPRSGELCDSKAIVGAAYGVQFPEEGPLKPEDFSGGEATVVPKLQGLGFEVVRIGEDWSAEEVQATVASYFEMLRLETLQSTYKKTEFNAALRQQLKSRSKASVELKHQNISAVLHSMELPFISGYKPRSNVQLLLRKAVQQFVLGHSDMVRQVVDAMEEVKTPGEKTFKAVVVQPPPVELIAKVESGAPRVRLPRKVDFAARDESNRKLGRAGEQWAIEFEHQRLADAGVPELLQRLDWVSDRLGDGAGYDILSYDAPGEPRYIEVKTTNGAHASSFVISRNELDFSQEAGDAFFLYRLFQFRQSPSLYMLRGDVSKQLHIEPIDYRASFRRVIG